VGSTRHALPGEAARAAVIAAELARELGLPEPSDIY
jgi:hypothetical protein